MNELYFETRPGNTLNNLSCILCCTVKISLVEFLNKKELSLYAICHIYDSSVCVVTTFLMADRRLYCIYSENIINLNLLFQKGHTIDESPGHGIQ